MAEHDTQYTYPAGTALGMLIAISTALGTAHVGLEVLAAGPQPVTIVVFLGSLIVFSCGVAMWSGVIGRRPRRSPPLDR